MRSVIQTGATMNSKSVDGKLQVTAAISLLERSLLVRWEHGAFSPRFTAGQQSEFESCWKTADPVFGRLICWILFSTGAEFLAKGVCLLSGIDVRDPKPKPVPAYPSEGDDIATWAPKLLANSNGPPVHVTYFGNLNRLVGDAGQGKLQELCNKAKAQTPERDLLLAAYLLLRKSVRNRDAHAYVPDVRHEHFWLVEELFVPSFNLLVSWIPGGAPQIDAWRKQAPNFTD